MTVKRIVCIFLVAALLVVPVSAEYSSYYEVDPVVSSPELFSSDVSLAVVGDSGISPLAATSWDTSDSTHLTAIYNAMINGLSSYSTNSILGILFTLRSNSNSIVSDVDSILTALTTNQDSSILGHLFDIEYYDSLIYSEIQNLDNVTVPYANNKLDQIYSALTNTTDGIKPVVSIMASRLNSILSDTDVLSSKAAYRDFYYYGYDSNGNEVELGTKLSDDGTSLFNIYTTLAFDGVNSSFGDRTFYSRFKQLQEVLASDDDLALANSQKANREEIEDSFLSGSSGSTSLGVSDFSALSDVGGTVKDTISLNGQSSVSDFTSGLTGADEAGQGWFSESTRSQLDSVSSVTSYDLRSDPYNMSGWQQRYAWVEGE